MALKSYKPTTPGQRGLVLIDRSELWKGRPVKSLTEGLTKSGGRNNTGRITSRRRGGGAKRLYRIVDFRRNKLDVAATVERIEYDPNRTAFIALVKYADGEQAYILAPQRLAVGDQVTKGQHVADIIDPTELDLVKARTPLYATTDGFILSRRTRKLMFPGESVMKIVGREVLESRQGGYLLED